MRKIIIDLDLLSSLNITPNDYCFLYARYFNLIDFEDSVNFDRLEAEGYIKLADKIVLREKAKSLLEGTMTPKIEGVSEWIDDFRGLFRGKKIGSMGDKKSCIKKMDKFLNENPEVTKEQIMTSTERYINSERKNNYMYLQRADYFISKQDNNKNETSRLAIMVEEVEGLMEVGVSSSDIEDEANNTFIRDI